MGERLAHGLSVLTVGDGPPLVSIPGLGQGADLAQEVPRSDALSARALATTTGRTVHLINRPLEMPPGSTIADVAGWYADVLRNRFDGPVDVFGASAGGVTALQLALDHPEVVAKLVVAIAASRLGEEGKRALLANVDLDGRRWGAAWAGSALMRAGRCGSSDCSRCCWAAAGEVAMIRAGQTWDVTDRLDEITAPTMVVGGTRDAVVPVELIEATARGIRGARLVLLPGKGHLTALLDTRATKAFTAFLQG